MDHFALPEDDLARAQAEGGLQRNFMGYTTHGDCDLIGLGMSAISHIGDSFGQNFRELRSWEAALERDELPVWRGRVLDHDDVLRADIIQRLMCQGEIDFLAVEHSYGIEFASYFRPALQQLAPLAADALVELDRKRLRVTARGRLLLRIVAMCFDRYLPQAPAGAPALYSKVV
jgi:oxygen-independent coproporphyrinogen-3 oxidase